MGNGMGWPILGYDASFTTPSSAGAFPLPPQQELYHSLLGHCFSTPSAPTLLVLAAKLCLMRALMKCSCSS